MYGLIIRQEEETDITYSYIRMTIRWEGGRGDGGCVLHTLPSILVGIQLTLILALFWQI